MTVCRKINHLGI